MVRRPLFVVLSLFAFAAALPLAMSAQESSANAASRATVVAAAPIAAQDSVPRLVQFNGLLKDAAARPVVGVASVTFAIYSEQDGGTTLWSETQNVIADANGHFSALLGGATTNGIPAELFGTGQSRWLGITIARQQEMPRVLLASVPYALKAGDADTLGGLPASAYVTTQSLDASSYRATTPIVGGNTTVIATPQVATASNEIPQVTPSGSGTTDFIPIWTSSSALGNSLLFQTGGRLGFGTTTPAATFDLNGGEILRGGFYEYPQGTATASTGQPSHSFQWLASVFNSSTKKPVDYAFGFRALPESNNTSNPGAKLDLFYGTGGPDGTTTDTGLSIDSAGIVTFVSSQTFDGAAETVGEINLPNSTSATSGTLTMGGSPFIADYGSTTNTFVGQNAGGAALTTGTATFNTAVGTQALYANVSGYNNVAIGTSALQANTSGNYNVAVGTASGQSITTGQYNTSIGEESLLQNSTGTENVAIGYSAGYTNTTGNFNTFLGPETDASAANLTAATAIGAGAVVGESNAVVIGSSGIGAPAVGIGTRTPSHTLDVVDRGSGTAAIYSSSLYAGDTAVYGISTATTGSGSNGGFFSSASPNGSGVVGSNLSGGFGGYFQGNNYAGYFAGNVGISGTLTKGAGSFKIDDPIDPANKYLSHSFVESPDMKNIYDGTVVTDAKGYATVTMPTWFEALNRDFRYQLTTINSFSRATVSQELKNGKFRIRTSRPNVKVSWQLTGIRHDAYADAHRIPTEEEKPADEQGHYLHPELFGAGPDKAVTSVHSAVPASASETHAEPPANH
jgi:hypothetical protein